MDMRKKVKLTIELRHEDLLNWEDYITCIPVCEKHHGFKGWEDLKLPEEFNDFPWVKCEDCEKVKNKWRRGMYRAYCQCWDEFIKKAGWNKP
ncbi:MAG TPA: hypothetical protein VMZ91_08300 [Candidatus Paceibacterota bacterium]|nr:hypothetical protein [Candidatus Paceibacterota bacterium]